MVSVLVASSNPVKIQAVREGFECIFPDVPLEVAGIDVPSGVPEQPFGDGETRLGALNRVLEAARKRPGYDYYAGIEGGIEDEPGEPMRAFAWVVVQRDGRVGTARSGSFELPPGIAALVRQGVELGEADDRVFQRQDSKRRDGAIGILTGGAIDRRELYAHAVGLALVAFINPDLYE